jgi:hypothetical protein
MFYPVLEEFYAYEVIGDIACLTYLQILGQVAAFRGTGSASAG